MIEDTEKNKPESLTQKIMRYEADGMTFDEEVSLFQQLIDTGMAWQLQGHYGRTAAAMIEGGHCTKASE